MIKKVLIAEDHQSMNLSLQKTLEELGINDLDHVYYCDDALAKIKKAVHANQPYDLLVTDLVFDDNDEQQQLKSGQELIAAAKAVQPYLSVLVFSAEYKPANIDQLYTKLAIDGYVRKARYDIKELKMAIDSIANNQRYYPRPIAELVKQKNVYAFTTLDVAIISQMIEGKKLQEIPAYLKTNNLQPSSLSSIEKRLNLIKDSLDFSSNEQLVAHCVRMGIV